MKSYSTLLVSVALVLLLKQCSGAATGMQVKQNPQRAQRGPSSRVAIGDKEYFFSEETSLNWVESRDACELLGMRLVDFESEEENTAVLDYIVDNPLLDLWRWSGGYRPENSSEWLWVATGAPMTYINWASGQPSNQVGPQDCSNFAGFFGGWDDDDCEQWLMSYLCEAPLPATRAD